MWTQSGALIPNRYRAAHCDVRYFHTWPALPPRAFLMSARIAPRLGNRRAWSSPSSALCFWPSACC